MPGTAIVGACTVMDGALRQAIAEVTRDDALAEAIAELSNEDRAAFHRPPSSAAGHSGSLDGRCR